MEQGFKVISRSAERLSRNPLGIIALFIVLVYGIASLVLSTAGLTPDQKWPFIWFLIIFPVIVLGIFSWFVTRHHTKLYAPSDYQDKEGFFRALSPEEQKERLKSEVQQIKKDVQAESKDMLIVGRKGTGKTVFLQSLKPSVMLAEDLVMKELESEFGFPIRRQVMWSDKHYFDGVFRVRNHDVVVEIKLTTKINWKQFANQVKSYAITLSAQKSFFPFYMLLAIVSEGLTDEQITKAEKDLLPVLNDSPVPIKLRVYQFQGLKEKYGLTDN